MAKNKTTETKQSVSGFIAGIADERKRQDAQVILQIFTKETGFEPKMWGANIIGFGQYHYKYDSGHEGDAPYTGFSPRSTSFALYLSSNFPERPSLLEQLGKHKTGKGCVYIQKVSDIDLKVLGKMIKASLKHSRTLYP